MELSKLISSAAIAFTFFTTAAIAEDISVLSAVVKNKVIDNAKVTFQKNGETSQRVTSDSRGKISSNPLSDDENTTMLIEKEGYSTLVVKCPCDGFTYALSPNMANLDGLRVVLTWGSRPSDLDSHLVFPDNHIFFAKRKGQAANLDVDDTDSYGPETITIEQKKVGQRYVYAVHDFSNTSKTNSYALSNSQARVDVYIGQTLMRTYNVKKQTNATTWVVFGIDGDGAFHDINQYIPQVSVAKHLHSIVSADTFDADSIITNAMKTQARRLNTAGEKAYANKKYEQAMYLFLDAVNLNPELSQAYSNLGVTYPKLNRNAEALWANRKAIDLASGSRAATIKGSSFYNIARIYEKNGEWQAALTSFEKALSFREHSAYHKGIDRMKAKLGN